MGSVEHLEEEREFFFLLFWDYLIALMDKSNAYIARSGNFCADSNRQTTDGQADHFNPCICPWGPRGDSSFKCTGMDIMLKFTCTYPSPQLLNPPPAMTTDLHIYVSNTVCTVMQLP